MDARHESSKPEYRRALQIFMRFPQTKLIRHLCTSVAQDPLYFKRNRGSIERVVEDVLRTQGLNPESALAGTTVFSLIREAAMRLRVKTSEEHWIAL